MKQWCIRWRDKNKPEYCGVYAGPWDNINTAYKYLATTISSVWDLWVDECVECPEFCRCEECICIDCNVSRDECVCLHDEYCGCEECNPDGEIYCCDDPECWCADIDDNTYDDGIQV